MREQSLNFRTTNISRLFKHNWQLYILLLPSLVILIIFMYVPMYGVVIAFKDYNAKLGIMGSPWVGLKYFQQFFSTSIAKTTIVNTFALGFLTLLFSFPIPIIFALLLNQLRSDGFRRFVQTASYAPYFISNVVVVSIMAVILAPSSGFVNHIIVSLGGQPKLFMSRPEYFRPLYVISGIWQTMGFNAIIYLAALTAVSPEYHEAAVVDGASKLQRIIHIDIPMIMPTVAIMFIITVGNVLNIGYEKVYLMQNGMNLAVSEVISTYVYKTGLLSAQYSFATAVGLFNSVVNFMLLIVANTVTRKMADISIF